MVAGGPVETGAAESRLTGALDAVRAVAEGYPTLRAAENFLRLQTDPGEIEDEIQAARRIFSANVQAYNTRIQVMPNAVVGPRVRIRAARVLRDRAARAAGRAGGGGVNAAAAAPRNADAETFLGAVREVGARMVREVHEAQGTSAVWRPHRPSVPPPPD